MYADDYWIDERDACDGSCGGECSECNAEAIQDELERCGFFLATWEFDLVNASAEEEAPLPCDVCQAESFGDLMGIPCCGSKTCTATIEAEIAADRAEMDRHAAEPMTPLAMLLLASIALKRQEREALAV
jgi:hypothetical protein